MGALVDEVVTEVVEDCDYLAYITVAFGRCDENRGTGTEESKTVKEKEGENSASIGHRE
jgi:hypothetical protein